MIKKLLINSVQTYGADRFSRRSFALNNIWTKPTRQQMQHNANRAKMTIKTICSVVVADLSCPKNCKYYLFYLLDLIISIIMRKMFKYPKVENK